MLHISSGNNGVCSIVNETAVDHRIQYPRSVLYTKPDSAEVLTAASQQGADAILVNFEFVPETELATARKTFSDWLQSDRPEGSRVWVKFTENDHMNDLAAITAPIDFIMVPDAEVEQLTQLSRAIDAHEAEHGIAAGTIRLNALVEDARGLLTLDAIASVPRVHKLGIGRVDLMRSLRMTVDPEGAEITKFLVDLVVASAAAGIDAPLASLYQVADDLEGLRETTKRMRSLGFIGRTAAYPQHIETLNEVFAAD